MTNYLDLEGVRYLWQKIKERTPAVYRNTTAYWNSDLTYVPEEGDVIIYTDHDKDGDMDVPGIKIGDGNAYLVDLPFIGGSVSGSFIDQLEEHINNQRIHVDQNQKDTWNNKIDLNEDQAIINETLVFSRN